MSFKTFNQLIDFTRTSAATYVGSNGLVAVTPASRNLLTYTQEFNNAAWAKVNCQVVPNVNPAAASLGPELITNGDFSGGATGWTFGSDWSVGAGVATKVAINSQEIVQGTAVVGKLYALTFTIVSVTSGSFIGRIGGADIGPNFSSPGTYTVYGVASGAGGFGVRGGATAAGSIDNISVKEVIGGAILAPDGTYTADKVIKNATTAAAYFGGFLAGTGNYTFSMYLKAGEQTNALLHIENSPFSGSRQLVVNLSTGALLDAGTGTGVSLVSRSVTSVGNGWYRAVLTVNVTSGTSVVPRVYPCDAAGSFDILGDGVSGFFAWGAQLETGTTVTDYTRNVGGRFPPRFDYDPVTLAPRGLLIEEQRTNLLPRSEEFDNASWAKEGSTVTANALASPSGATVADKLQEDATTGVHRLNVSVTSTTAVHAVSIFARAAERNWIAIGNASDAQFVYFDVQNGTVGNANGGATGTITNHGGGWYRCTVIFTPTATSRTYSVWLASANGTASYAGVAGNGVHIWGAQLEAGAFATSYIPTAASQVTRTADVATITEANFSQWYNQSAGTFVMEFQTLVSGAVPATIFGLVANADTSKRFIYVGSGADQASTFDGTTILTATGDITGPVAKVASTYDASGRAIASNGGAVTSGAVVAGFSSATSLNIGILSGNPGFGWIRSIRYYPTRLTNAQLQALTA